MPTSQLQCLRRRVQQTRGIPELDELHLRVVCAPSHVRAAANQTRTKKRRGQEVKARLISIGVNVVEKLLERLDGQRGLRA